MFTHDKRQNEFMQLRQILMGLFFLGGVFSAWSQEVATLEVDSPDESLLSAIPVSADLDQITHLADSMLVLVEWVDGQAVPVNFQTARDNGRKLVWLLDQKRKGVSVFKLMQ